MYIKIKVGIGGLSTTANWFKRCSFKGIFPTTITNHKKIAAIIQKIGKINK